MINILKILFYMYKWEKVYIVILKMREKKIFYKEII